MILWCFEIAWLKVICKGKAVLCNKHIMPLWCSDVLRYEQVRLLSIFYVSGSTCWRLRCFSLWKSFKPSFDITCFGSYEVPSLDICLEFSTSWNIIISRWKLLVKCFVFVQFFIPIIDNWVPIHDLKVRTVNHSEFEKLVSPFPHLFTK